MPEKRTARVILFKPSGKYYTEEEWEIPTAQQALSTDLAGIKLRLGIPISEIRADITTPFGMIYSKDFRRIKGGPVLVPAQEPWGYPHLLPGRER